MKGVKKLFACGRFFRISIFMLSIAGVGCGGGGGGGGGGGNGSSTPTPVPFVADLPFNYSFGTRTLEVGTPGGQTIYVSVGSYGAHFLPMSGDLLGDFKSNLIGLFAYNRSELAELPGTGGNGDGICDGGESCAFWGGSAGERIVARIPVYTAPADGTLTRVTLLAPPGPGYFGSPPHWEIQIRFNSQFSIRIGHLARISTSLRDKIWAATGIDTDIYTAPTGAIVTDGTIAVSAGESLAQPQVFANEIQPGYYIGGGTVSGIPWAQMEFTFGDNQAQSDVCVYDLLAPADKAAIQQLMENDMLDTMSPRFSPYAASQWIWRAEGVLCPVYSADWIDYSNIHARVGGWTERPEPGTVVDELFAIVKIEKTSAAYDATLYSSSAVDHLAARSRGPGLPPFNWIMPDSTSVTPFIAVGEVLEETANSLLIMWRDIGWTGPVYQRAAFLLDSNGLKIKWGDFGASAIEAISPALAANEACDDATVICYDHQARL